MDASKLNGPYEKSVQHTPMAKPESCSGMMNGCHQEIADAHANGTILRPAKSTSA